MQFSKHLPIVPALIAATMLVTPPTITYAQSTAYTHAVATAASQDSGLAAFYKARNFEPIWTGNTSKDRARRRAFLKAAQNAEMHGLPAGRYAPAEIKQLLSDAASGRSRGTAEVKLSQMFLQYARDIQTGVLVPSRIDEGLVRKVGRVGHEAQLNAFAASNPRAYIESLTPKSPEYVRLLKEKVRFADIVAAGGWGATVPGSKIEPGQSNANVVALRDRLVAMGYMKRSASTVFDATLQQAVQQFQIDHGLSPDGIAGGGTLAEINTSAEKRLRSIHVALERERWTNFDRGSRHVWVNLTDFTAKIMDNNKVTFETRSVIGADTSDRRSPEFSDVMEHLVINPTWNVPRSIATKEYLPMLQKNPNAVSHLNLVTASGKVVSRAGIDFNQYTKSTFPFNIKQPPSKSNALGLVKFIFPNKYNIYLHDTPAKNLFSRETRAFSHGCIRLADPFDFAYALLAKQESNPKGFFHKTLDTGREAFVPLKKQVPVHIIYRTAVSPAKGRINFRRDIYGRDAKIFAALSKAGVEI